MTGDLTPLDDWGGTVVISRHGDRVRIDHADPRVRISYNLLRDAMDGEVETITVDGDQMDRVTLTDDFGRRYIYRLGQYDQLYDAFRMEWPD